MWSLASCLGDSIGQDRQVSTALSLVQQRAGSGVAGRAAALAGFQKFADGLVAKYTETRTDPDEDTIKAIQTVIDWIDTFYANFLAEHSRDLKHVTDCPGDVDSCVTSYWLNGNKTHDSNEETLNILEGAVKKARTAHSTCLSEMSTCQNEQTEACSKYDDHRETYRPLPLCVGRQELSDTYIQADVDDNFDGESCAAGVAGGEQCLPKMESCLVEFNDWVVELYTLYIACKRTDDPCAENCKTEQKEFETEHCSWGEFRVAECNAYNECVAKETARCTSLCSDVAIRSDARKADNETGERIKCLLNVLINTTTNETQANVDKPGLLNACVEKEYNNEDWTIQCPAGDPVVVPPVDCTPPLPDPVTCTQDFLEDEYNAFADVSWCDCRQCLALGGPQVDFERDKTLCPENV